MIRFWFLYCVVAVFMATVAFVSVKDEGQVFISIVIALSFLAMGVVVGRLVKLLEKHPVIAALGCGILSLLAPIIVYLVTDLLGLDVSG